MKEIAEAFHSPKDHALLNEVPLRTENEKASIISLANIALNINLTLRISFQLYDSDVYHHIK